MNIRYLSLFSGIEACTVAWKPLGWEAVAFAQYEPGDNIQFASKLLEYYYPEIPNLGDVTKITEEQIKSLGHIDIVVGGSPCQDLSLAGLRKGLRSEDGNVTRSGLFDYQMQIFEWARKNNGARFMLWENVPGAFSSNEGNDFAYILGSMVQRNVPVPKDGWKNAGVCVSTNGDRIIEWRVLDAQYFGVPQRRRRVFALLDSGAWGGAGPVLFESESLSRDFEKSAGKRKGSPESSEDDFGKDGFNPERGGYELVGTLTARDYKGIGNQYINENKLVIEKTDTIAFTCEPQMAVSMNVMPTIRQRDYKDPNDVCYENIAAYDMKQHHNPQDTDTISITTKNCNHVRGDTPLVMEVVSWKERDRLSNPKVNVSDPVTSTDYKGSSLVGYYEDKNHGEQTYGIQMANTGSNRCNINNNISPTLNKNNTIAVVYDE